MELSCRSTNNISSYGEDFIMSLTPLLFLVVDLFSKLDFIFLTLTNLRKKDNFVSVQSPSIYLKTMLRRCWPRKLTSFGNENVLNT